MLIANAAAIAAAHEHRLLEAAPELISDPESLSAVLETGRRIEDELDRELAAVGALLEAADVQFTEAESAESRQYHSITFSVADADAANAAARVLESHGFDAWDRWTGGALESFRRTADQMTVARTNDVTLMVRLRWRPRRRHGLWERIVTPTAGDWQLVSLPTWAWRAYPLVRVFRLAVERAGLRTRHAASLGPFLATPDSLLNPLFDLAELSREDVVVDLGAGDGRIVVAAAARHQCRAVGIEQDATLVKRAQARAAAAGVEDLVQWVHGDAAGADLGDATVVFLFLPVEVVGDLLDELVARLRPGTKVIVHEQRPLPGHLQPSSSSLLVGANAFTVAHQWVVPVTADA